MSVEVYVFVRVIENSEYIVNIPCKSRADADAMALMTGMRYEGEKPYQIPVIDPEQLLRFIEPMILSKTDGEVLWRGGAADQVGAFINCGWPVRPERG